MNHIQKFFGRHWDLTQIIAIGDAVFVNHMGHGGYFVQFEVHAQLLDRPIVVSMESRGVFASDADFAEQRYLNDNAPDRILNSGSVVPRRLPDGRIADRVAFQEEIDRMVAAWKEL